MEWDKRNRKKLPIFAGSSWGRPGRWLSNGCEAREQALCSPNTGGEGEAPALQGPLCAHPQARGYHPSAPLFWVSENFPTPRIPGPQYPKRPSRSSLLTTSQLRNPSELLSSLCLNYPKTGSSLPYKAARSLADLPGLLESPSLNSSRASFTNTNPLCPSASCSYLRRNKEPRVPRLEGFGHSASVTRRWSPDGNLLSELSCTPAQLPSTWPPAAWVYHSGHHSPRGRPWIGALRKVKYEEVRDEPEGFKARDLEEEAPKLPPPPPKNSLFWIQVLAASSGGPVD